MRDFWLQPEGRGQARKKLPELLFKKLLDISGQNLEQKVGRNNLWQGRHVKSIDCSTVSMPDTLKTRKYIHNMALRKKVVGFWEPKLEFYLAILLEQ